MRRLLRWTFNSLAAASLLLCVATAALWVRSHWVYDLLYAERGAFSVYSFQYRATVRSLGLVPRRALRRLGRLVRSARRPTGPAVAVRDQPPDKWFQRPPDGFQVQRRSPVRGRLRVHHAGVGRARLALACASPSSPPP